MSADNTERVIDALEAIASKEVAASGAPPARVRWSLTASSTSNYRLTNVGDSTAYDVRVSGHETLGGIQRDDGLLAAQATMQEGEAIFIHAFISLATSDTTVTVSWLDEPGVSERREWRYPLP